ncbi:hypothetical protein ACI5FR_08785 [Paenibacillus sp. HJGM_3]
MALSLSTRETKTVERAVGQILDEQVRRIIEFRFLEGNSRAATLMKFASWNYSDKTIDRKILEGIESVANTLLYIE